MKGKVQKNIRENGISAVHKNAVFSKSDHLELWSLLTTNRKSCVGFSKIPFFNPYDDLERQQTSPRTPQQTPVKNFTP